MAQVNAELGLLATTNISLNQANVRALAGVPAGTISMNDLRGKPTVWSATISTPQQEMNLYTWATGQGYPGTIDAEITVAPGVYIWSDNTAVSALTIPNGFGSNNLTVVNQGYIMGKGGNGTAYTPPGAVVGVLGNPGGPAISLLTPVTIDNTFPNGYIGGGGGSASQAINSGGGGGAGGGHGGATPAAGNYGLGGAIGQPGTPAQPNPSPAFSPVFYYFGGGGGRIFPGNGGQPEPGPVPSTSPRQVLTGGGGGGAGGGGGGSRITSPRGGADSCGGGGGGWGAAGGWPGALDLSQGLMSPVVGTLGGSSNQVGESAPATAQPPNLQPGYGGNAVTLNGNSVTWTFGDTARVWGSVS